jgi:hypothetical protein
MPRLRPLLAGIVLVLLACLGGRGRRPRQPARRRGAGHGRRRLRGQRRRQPASGRRPGRLGPGRAAAGRPASTTSACRPPAPTTPPWPGCGPWPAPASSSTWPSRPAPTRRRRSRRPRPSGAAGGRHRGPGRRAGAPLRRAILAQPETVGVTVLGRGPGADPRPCRLGAWAGAARAAWPTSSAPATRPCRSPRSSWAPGVPDAVAARYLPRLLLANAGLAVRTYVEGTAATPGPACSARTAPPPSAYATVAPAARPARRRPQAGRARTGSGFRLAGDTDAVRTAAREGRRPLLAGPVGREAGLGPDRHPGGSWPCPASRSRWSSTPRWPGRGRSCPSSAPVPERSFTDPPGPAGRWTASTSR